MYIGATPERLSARYTALAQRATTQDLPVLELINAVEELSTGGRDDLARQLYRVWLDCNPNDPLVAAIQFNLGTLLLSGGALPEAQEAFRACIALRPDFMSAHLNLGSALEGQGDIASAVAQWLVVVNQLSAVSNEAVAYKTMALKQIGRVCEHAQDQQQAEEALRQCLDLHPQQRDVAEHWLVLRQIQCKWPVVQPWASMSRSALIDAMSPLLLARHADTPMFQLAVAYRYYRNDAAQRAAPYTVGAWAPPEGERPERLRIGYVCSDMRAHALGSLIVGIFGLHDRARFEVFAYYTGPDVRDTIRARIESSVDHWRTISKLGDKPAAAAIVQDGIDVLVDLNGHTDAGRPGVFALRPAPIIVNWLGYPGTMGTAHHHYIIADTTIIPPEFEKYYSERVKHLPCYQPNDCARPVDTACPSRRDVGLPDSAMVYCCFNSTAKVTPLTFARWMTILRHVPHAVLWLLSTSDAVDKRLQQAAAEAGVAPERLIFAGRLAPTEHLPRYALADLFLDTTPYGAHTTASDALWMGLPVLTFLGRSFAARVCASLVRAAGLGALACENADAYVQMAVRLGHDPAALAQCRQTLQDARGSCALFDTAGLVAHLEQQFDEMWNEHITGHLPVPDLTNLDLYAEIGKDEPHESVETCNLEDYERYYRVGMAYRNGLSPIPADRRLWQTVGA
jgi:predicted O-linked N-acetylglucosamine transferase (SPINDLY family)